MTSVNKFRKPLRPGGRHPAMGETFANPEYRSHLETVSTAMIEERKRTGSYDAFRKRILTRS